MSGSTPPADKASLLAPAFILQLIAALDALRFGSVKIAVHEVRKDLRRRLQYSLFSDPAAGVPGHRLRRRRRGGDAMAYDGSGLTRYRNRDFPITATRRTHGPLVAQGCRRPARCFQRRNRRVSPLFRPEPTTAWLLSIKGAFPCESLWPQGYSIS